MADRQPLFSDFPPVSSDEWHQRIREELGSDAEASLTWRPPEGFPVAPFYRKEDLSALDHVGADRPTAATPTWQIRQDVVADDPAEANALARLALQQGADALGLSTTSAPHNSGIPIRSLSDMQRLLDDVPLDETPLHLEGGPHAPAALAAVLETARRRGLDPHTIEATVDLDPYALLVRSGTLAADDALAETNRLFHEDAPASVRLLAMNVSPYHEAGATAVQELAFAMSTLSDYLASLTDSGLEADVVCHRLHLVVPVGSSYLMEIAKLRALRLLYRQVAGAYAEGPAPPAYVQAVTSRRPMTLYDPDVNLLRGTTQAAAAVLGGADVVSVRPFDEVAETSGSHAQRLARNTQLILREEAGLGDVADPAGGAYYVEVLTDRLARSAWELFQEVEAQGGHMEALRRSFIQEQIRDVRRDRQERIARGDERLVGSTWYPDPDERRLGDATIERPATTSAPSPPRQCDPDSPLASRCRALREGASFDEIPFPRKRGDAISVTPLPAVRLAEPFEEIRLRTERFARRNGRTPVALLLPAGPPKERAEHVNTARHLLGLAGLAVRTGPGIDVVDDALGAIREHRPSLAVLSGPVDAYAALLLTLHEQLLADDFDGLLAVTGAPDDALESEGVDVFIHRGANTVETLRAIQRGLGMKTTTDDR